ncbi:MAG: MoaD/ThiS family protein [Bacillota bacterium]
MIKVQLVGRLKHRYKIRSIEVEEGSIDEVIARVVEKHPEIRKEDLKNALPIVKRDSNAHHKSEHRTLNAGDTLVFMSPVGGG